MVVFGQKWMYSGKVAVFGQNVYIRKQVVIFWKKWLYSGKGGCIRAKVVVFGQKWLYLDKVVLFGQK